MGKTNEVFEAILQLSNGTNEEYRITASSSFTADRILDKYIQNNQIEVMTKSITLLDGEKAQTDRTRIYNESNKVLLEAPTLKDGEVKQGYNWEVPSFRENDSNESVVNDLSNEDIIVDILAELKKIDTSELDDDSIYQINAARINLENVWDYIGEIND